MTTTPIEVFRIIIQPRRGTAAEAAVSNVVPAMGERIYVMPDAPGEKGRWKTGDGSTPVKDLPYDEGITSTIAEIPGLQDALDAKALAGHTHAIDALDISGTPNGQKFLRDDGSWALAPGAVGEEYTTTEKAKLAGIADSATANDSDANLRNRTNHTGTQAASTISDFNDAADARIVAANPVFKSDTTVTGIGFVDNDPTLAGNSALKLATQQAVRQYVLTKFAELIGAAPDELDTWIELVAAIQNNEDAIGGINTALANRQDKDPTLTALATVVTAANKLIYADGPDSFTTTDFTAFARTLLAGMDAAGMRETLGVRPGTEVQAYSARLAAMAAVTITSGSSVKILGTNDQGATWTTIATFGFGRNLMGAGDAVAARAVMELGPLAILNPTGTPSGSTFLRGDGTWAAPAGGGGDIAVPVWFEVHAAYDTRAVGYGVNTMGLLVPEAFTLTGVVYRGETADASGSSTFELRRNGTAIAGTSKAITAANQWAYDSDIIVSGLSVALAAGDVLRPYISAIGTTPGKGFSAVLIGTKTVTAS